jgi:hypothetical protein
MVQACHRLILSYWFKAQEPSPKEEVVRLTGLEPAHS